MNERDIPDINTYSEVVFHMRQVSALLPDRLPPPCQYAETRPTLEAQLSGETVQTLGYWPLRIEAFRETLYGSYTPVSRPCYLLTEKYGMAHVTKTIADGGHMIPNDAKRFIKDSSEAQLLVVAATGALAVVTNHIHLAGKLTPTITTEAATVSDVIDVAQAHRERLTPHDILVDFYKDVEQLSYVTGDETSATKKHLRSGKLLQRFARSLFQK